MLFSALPAPTASAVLRRGLLGSVLLLLGSVGIGWLAGSSFLVRTWPFIIARTSFAAVMITTVITVAGAFLLLSAWLRLRYVIRDNPDTARPLLRKAAWWWTIPMALAMPLFSRDMYAYIGQGRLMTQGLDPYVNGISSLSNYFQLGSDTMWTEAPTPYGPLWLWIEYGTYVISGGIPEVALAIFRLFGVLGVVLLFIYVPRLAALSGFDENLALWLAVLNPVVLINFVASGHNDSLMMGLLVMGMYYAARRKGVLGVVLVTLSIAVKPITVLALPFVGMLWAGKGSAWPRRIGYWAATAGISLGLLGVAGLVNGFGFGWIAAIQTPGAVWMWYAPVGLIGQLFGLIVGLFGGPGPLVVSIFSTLAKGLAVLILVWLVFRWPKNDSGYVRGVVLSTALGFSAVVLLAPVIQPWYMIWLLVLFASSGFTARWAYQVVNWLSVFFVAIAVTDQLQVYSFIPQFEARVAAIIASACGVVWLVFLEKYSREQFLLPATIRSWRPGTGRNRHATQAAIPTESPAKNHAKGFTGS